MCPIKWNYCCSIRVGSTTLLKIAKYSAWLAPAFPYCLHRVHAQFSCIFKQRDLHAHDRWGSKRSAPPTIRHKSCGLVIILDYGKTLLSSVIAYLFAILAPTKVVFHLSLTPEWQICLPYIAAYHEDFPFISGRCNSDHSGYPTQLSQKQIDCHLLSANNKRISLRVKCYMIKSDPTEINERNRNKNNTHLSWPYFADNRPNM